MALPLIKVNSATGSDTEASGAGPATAVYGSTGVSAADGLTVDLSADTPDLSGVATDGSAVLFFNDTTAGQRNFAKITDVNDGTKVVTVANAVQASQTKGWAIGGKRASIGSSSSKKLFDENGSAGDTQAGWIVEMESGHAENIAARLDVRVLGSITAGRFILRGASDAATRPVITLSGSGDFVPRVDYQTYQDFDITGGASYAIIGAAVIESYLGLKITCGNGIQNPGGSSQIIGCEISGGGNGIQGTLQGAQILGNYIHGLTGDGINYNGTISGLEIYGNVIYDCGGDGIDLTQGRIDSYGSCRIMQNVLDLCDGDGIKYSGLSASMANLIVMNNSVSNAGVYGVDLVDAGADTIEINAYRPTFLNNNTYGSGTANFRLGDGTTGDGTINVGDSHIDPDYTSVVGEDFTSSALADLGFPQTMPNL